MKRKILHADLDAFFCAVEILDNPGLKDSPFVVGGSPSGRGVVASASYPARAFGVRSAMPTSQALRLCPELIVLPGRHSMYSEYSRKVMAVFFDAAPVVEQISIDEAFLDVSDDPLPGRDLAMLLQQRIRSELGLPTSWGVAANKLVAKIATDLGKPDGLIEVPFGEEAAFLAPLPVDAIWGIGPRTQEVLAARGIATIGDLAEVDAETLKAMFGERGKDLADYSCGIDHRKVTDQSERRSISCERTFAKDVAEEYQMVRILQQLIEELCCRLREEDLYAATVKVKVRNPDFSSLSRQLQLKQPTDQDREIFQVAKQLLEKINPGYQPVRLLGVGLSGLSQPIRQMDLFDPTWEKDRQLLQALDAIRNKYGPNAVKRAVRLKKKK